MPRTDSAERATTPLTAAERETVILIDDASGVASIATHQRRIITKLERNPAARKIEDLTHGSQPGARYEMPARLVSFRRPSPSRPDAARNLPKRSA